MHVLSPFVEPVPACVERLGAESNDIVRDLAQLASDLLVTHFAYLRLRLFRRMCAALMATVGYGASRVPTRAVQGPSIRALQPCACCAGRKIFQMPPKSLRTPRSRSFDTALPNRLRALRPGTRPIPHERETTMKKILATAVTLLVLTACNRGQQDADQSATTDTTAPAAAPATDTTGTMPATDTTSTSADMSTMPPATTDTTTTTGTDTTGTMPATGTDTGTGTTPPTNTDANQQNNGNTTPPTP
jgi:hypothetical protein